MDISNQIFEPRHRIMVPEFEDLCYGTDLKNGMIVLIEDSLVKGDPEHIDSDYSKMRLMEANRWCEVTNFRIIPRVEDSPLIKFIGLYSDRTKLPRTYDASYCWIMKVGPELNL